MPDKWLSSRRLEYGSDQRHNRGLLLNRCGRTELTSEAMKEMARLGVKPNIVSFNTILKVRSKSIVPLAFTLPDSKFVVQGYATGQKADLENALALLNEMRRLDVEPDVLSYNTVLNACAEALEMTTAKKLVVEMLKNNVKPDDFTITTLAKGTCCFPCG